MTEPNDLSESDAEIMRIVPREASRALLAVRLSDAIEAREIAAQAWHDHERRYGAELDETIQAAVEKAGIGSLHPRRPGASVPEPGGPRS